MICPYCGHHGILHGPSQAVHYVRLLLNSAKRYCPVCDKKWIAKRSGRVFSRPVVLGLILIAVLSVLLIEETGNRSFRASRIQGGTASGWNAGAGPKSAGQSAELLSYAKLVSASSKQSSGTGKKKDFSLPMNLFGVDAKLLEKARKKFKEDPNFLSKLTPAQRKRAEEKAKQYGFSLP